MNLKISSKGMYSTWGYYAPIRALFDCGEGCATNLGNYVYAPESIFLGHNHGDHVLGLPSFIGCRNSARGDKEKPLTVYYPESDMMKDLIEFIKKRNSRLSYELNFVEISPGFKLDFGNKMHLEAFYVKHCYKSLGFRIMEKRSRLKAGIDPKDAKALIAKGETISEEYFGNIFTWTLDSASYDLDNIQNCAHLIGDSTFIHSKDRDEQTHSSCEEVLSWAKKFDVKRVSLAHWSSRYNWNEIPKEVETIQKEIGYEGKIDIILPNKVHEL